MSELSLIRTFFDLVEKYPDTDIGYLGFISPNPNIEIIFRNTDGYDMIIVNTSNPRDYGFLFEYYDDITHMSICHQVFDKKDFKDDIKTMDDMELLLKYGRNISNEYIISDFKSMMESFDITIDDFKNFINQECTIIPLNIHIRGSNPYKFLG